MATPGARVSHGAWCTVSKAWRSMPRQVGVAGYSPTPRKRCDISSRIAAAHGQSLRWSASRIGSGASRPHLAATRRLLTRLLSRAILLLAATARGAGLDGLGGGRSWQG